MVYRSYPNYRSTECDWLPTLPAHWSLRPMKVVATCNDEALPETTDPDYAFDYVDISSVSLVEGIKTREHLTFEKAPSRARRIVRSGDSIVSTVRTYLKAVATINDAVDNLIVSTGFAVLRPGSELRPKYLGYYVQSHGFVDTVVARSTGVSYPAILATELGTIPTPVPSDDEQDAIADFLDRETARIDALIDKKRRLLELLEEKRLAVITHAVTKGLDPNVPMKNSGIDWLGPIPAHWEVKRQKFISSKITVGIVVTPAAYYVDEGVPTLRGFNIKERYIDRSDFVFISQHANELHAKSKIYKGDLVAVRTGQPGTTAVVPDDLDGANCVDLIIIRRSRRAMPAYAAYFANSDVAKLQYGAGSEGALQQHFNIDTAKNLVMPLPPLPEQQAILRHLSQEENKLLRAMETLQSSVDALTEYRSALITNAVTGKIDVRGEMAKEAAA